MIRLRKQIFGSFRWSKRPRGRRAQALTEFAIVAPVMVTCLLFAMYFYEVIQIKLKAQEVGRYAAWEFTGFPLHDYKEGKTTSGFSDAKTEINSDVARRYKNLRSTDTKSGKAWLMAGWDAPRVTMRDQIEPKIPGGAMVNQLFNFVGYAVDIMTAMSLNYSNPVLMAMMVGYYSEKYKYFGSQYNRFNPPKKWAFNTKGYPQIRVRMRFKNLLVPKYFMDGGQSGWFTGKHFQGTKKYFNEEVSVVADSWRMNYGEDVVGTKDKDKAYFKQVDRMAFVTPSIRNGMKMWTTFIQVASGIIALAAFHPPLTMDPLETTLVSKAYKGGDPASGKITIREDHDDGPQDYDTSPLQPGSEYEKTLKRRGQNFMGCVDPEMLGCFDSTSSNNPFGDYILPPEGH